MLQRELGAPLVLDVRYEPLQKGPIGERVAVCGYDVTRATYMKAVDLDDPMILVRDGLDPSSVDPRCHQQMVYAVAMRVLEAFDAALGRHLRFYGGRRLRLFPHAFQAKNAFYDPEFLAIFFGYYRASRQHPGKHLPGEHVFTCLSIDIIAHEMMHAMLDRLKPSYRRPTGTDVLAFHEGWSDAMTLLLQFTFPALVRAGIAAQRGDLRRQSLLTELAEQFGQTSGCGRALRSGLDDPHFDLYRSEHEPHARGSILSAAIFQTFVRVFERRTHDLICLATGGSGVLPPGELSELLIVRMTQEAGAAAQALMKTCIQALDYAPPVDITFGLFLRALITASRELDPADPYGVRTTLIEEFMKRDLCPEELRSTAEDALCWDDLTGSRMQPLPASMIGELFLHETQHSATGAATLPRPRERGESSGLLPARIGRMLLRYARENARALHLVDGVPIRIAGCHSSFRVDAFGQPVIKFVAQLVQEKRYQGGDLLGGTTLIADLHGHIQHLAWRQLPTDRAALAARLRDRNALLDELHAADLLWGWSEDGADVRRARLRGPFAARSRLT